MLVAIVFTQYLEPKSLASTFAGRGIHLFDITTAISSLRWRWNQDRVEAICACSSSRSLHKFAALRAEFDALIAKYAWVWPQSWVLFFVWALRDTSTPPVVTWSSALDQSFRSQWDRLLHGCYVQGQCGNLLKWGRGRKCEHGTMAGYEDAISNIFASLFLFIPSDYRKTSDCLKFSGLPSFEQYQDIPCRSKNAGSTISGLRWSPKYFNLTLLPWSFARQVVSFSMLTKFSAFYRCMLQLRAFCGFSARCRIVDRHVDLLSTTVCRVGGCKPSSLSRDTSYLAKEYSSEVQACFGVNGRSDVASVHSPFTCVACHRLLLRHRAAITQGKGRTWPCVCVFERWQPHAEACTLCLSSIVEKGHRRKEEKNTISCCPPAPRPFSSWFMSRYRSHFVCSAPAERRLQTK